MKPSILIISGWAFPAGAWARVVRRLESGWQVRVVGADTVLAGWRPGEDPAVLAGRIKSHLPSTRPCFLGGWSLGGMLAMQAAPLLTDLISGVLLVSTTPRFCRDDSQDWGIPQATVRAMARGLRSEPERTLERFYVSTAAPEEPDPDEMAQWTDQSLGNREGLDAGLAYLRQVDLRGQASCGGLPAMLLHGRNDAIIPYDASRALGIRLRPSRLDLSSDAGHDLPLRRPDVVVKGLHSLVLMCR